MSLGSPRSVLPHSHADANGQGLTAVVLGAGVAGLCAAHVLCSYFARVVLVEGDIVAFPAPEEGETRAQAIMKVAKQRRGIPQLLHPHTLAMGGLEALEAMLPGFQEELVRRGGVPLDLCRDFRFFDFGGTYVRCPDSPLKSVGASRALIQETIQEEVLRRNAGRLQLRDGCRAAGLLWDAAKAEVQGLELSSGEQLPADLVVVAGGRHALLPQWLAAAGHQVPPLLKVDAQLTYVGRMYRMPRGWDGKKEWLGSLCFSRPGGTVGAGMVPVEGGLWQMVAFSYGGVPPPMEEAAFSDFLRTLPDDAIWRALQGAEPVTPLEKYGGAYNVQRAWEAVPPPPGLLAIGDCVQALNPVYAQGMSVAAKSAECLGRVLEAALAPPAAPEARRATARSLGPLFQKQLARVVAPAWMMATSEDQRYPGTRVQGVSKPPSLLCLYIDALCKACHHSAQVMTTFFQVAHLVRPPTHLFRPSMVAAGIWQMLADAAGAVFPSLAAARR